MCLQVCIIKQNHGDITHRIYETHEDINGKITSDPPVREDGRESGKRGEVDANLTQRPRETPRRETANRSSELRGQRCGRRAQHNFTVINTLIYKLVLFKGGFW